MYIKDGKWPLYYGDIQLENPGWNLGDPLPEGWREVEETELPAASKTQVIREVEPVEKDGKLYRQWEVIDLTEEEIAARDTKARLRAELDKLGLSAEAAIDLLVR